MELWYTNIHVIQLTRVPVKNMYSYHVYYLKCFCIWNILVCSTTSNKSHCPVSPMSQSLPSFPWAPARPQAASLTWPCRCQAMIQWSQRFEAKKKNRKTDSQSLHLKMLSISLAPSSTISTKLVCIRHVNHSACKTLDLTSMAKRRLERWECRMHETGTSDLHHQSLYWNPRIN